MKTYKIPVPYKIKVVSSDENKGTFLIDGLYPGYGHTLGNSIRRIILSSLPGASLTEIKIEGISHEFQTIGGVKEDVIILTLNLKKIRFKMLSDEPQTVNLFIKGPKTVTAGDIKTGGQVEILNPDLYLMEITGKVNINIEMKIEKGLGFIPKETLKKDRIDLGTIVVDAIFTPIRRVSYDVENMRIGDNTDYNRLIITIETDGTLTAREAFEESIKIMVNQLRSIINLNELEKEQDEEEELLKEEKKTEEKVEKKEKDALTIKVKDIDFSTRTLNALNAANIATLSDLSKKTKDELRGLGGIGAKCISEIEDVLKKYNLALKI